MQLLDNIKSLILEKHKDDQRRYLHSLGVAKMAKYLAEIYGVDPEKAIIAGYLHDFCKNDSIEYINTLLSEEDKLECEKYPVLYHSYGSAEYYLKFIGNDIDVYNAIRNHVFGRVGMSKLEEIILISDYTEENRTYDDCIKVRGILLEGNLNKAIYESSRFVVEYISRKQKTPHPMQLEVLEYYKGLCE
jgi:predicted HD superfamily hydrolase involved in NAD metabolism